MSTPNYGGQPGPNGQFQGQVPQPGAYNPQYQGQAPQPGAYNPQYQGQAPSRAQRRAAARWRPSSR